MVRSLKRVDVNSLRLGYIVWQCEVVVVVIGVWKMGVSPLITQENVNVNVIRGKAPTALTERQRR